MSATSTCDSLVNDLLEEFALRIVKAISAKTKIDPDRFALSIPGLLHSHWYPVDEPIQGCLCCERRQRIAKEP
jgi:hypothetical protein